MNKAERDAAYQEAAEGCGTDLEQSVWWACARLPPHFEDRPAVWEGALLAGVMPWQLESLLDAGNWPALAAIADIAGERPWSSVVTYNRGVFADWRERAAEQAESPAGAKP